MNRSQGGGGQSEDDCRGARMVTGCRVSRPLGRIANKRRSDVGVALDAESSRDFVARQIFSPFALCSVGLGSSDSTSFP